MRLTIHQPTLTHYRLPVFRHLAGRSGVDLLVCFSALSHVSDGEDLDFPSTMVSPARRVSVFGQTLHWHGAQLWLAQSSRTDVLVLPWDTHHLSLVPALTRARTQGVASVVWGHGYSKRESASRRRIRDRIGHLADVVLLYDQTTADGLVARGFARDRVFVAPNTICQASIREAKDSWAARPEALRDFRRIHDLDGPVLIFVSRLLEPNRVDLLIDALPTVIRRHPRLRLVVVGDGPERAALEAQSQRVCPPGHVIFTGAIFDERELAPWMLCANVFVYPENIGLSLFHAFGYGLPVVVSADRSRQNPEIDAFRPGKNGTSYEPGSVQDLARSIQHLLENEPLTRAMGANALRLMETERTIARMADGFTAAAERALEQRRARRPARL